MPSSRLSSFPASAGIVPQQSRGSLESSLLGMPTPANQFDFILQNQQKPGRNFTGGDDKTRRLMIVIFGLGALVLITFIFFLIFGRGSGNASAVIDVMVQQQEIIRLASDGQQNLKDSNTLAIASTTLSVVEADQASLKSYLKNSAKQKVTTKQLNAGRSKKADTSLAAAGESGHYDSVFATILKSDLIAYQNDLKTAYKLSGSNGKALLESAYNSAETILSSPTLAASTADESSIQ